MSPLYKYNRDDLTTEPEVQGYIDRARDPWVKSLLGFLYIYGPRISEALAFRAKDLERTETQFVATIITLKRRVLKDSGPYGIQNYRTLRVDLDVTPFVDLITGYVEKYFASTPERRLFPYSRATAHVRMKKLSPSISAHLFRHDRLMKLALAGASGAVLMDWAGWSDLRPAVYYLQKAGRLAATFSGKVR